MPSDDRERTFENALASHLRAGSSAGVPGNLCADSEMLAAYHEGSLPPDQIASLKTHVPSCARCQEILALLEATDQIPLALPDVPRAAAAATKSGLQVLPAPKFKRWLWIAPAGALAAALLVWIAVQQTNSVRLTKQASTIGNEQTEIAKAQPTSPAQVPGPSLDATRKTQAAPLDAFGDFEAVSPSQIDPALKRRSRSLAKEKDSLSAKNEGTPAGPPGGIVDGLTATLPKSVTPPASQQSLPPRGAAESVTAEAANSNELAQSKSDAAQAELEEKSASNKRAAVTFRPTAPAPAIADAAPPPAPAPSTPSRQVNTESAARADHVVQQSESTDLTTLGGTAGLRLANSVGAVTVSAPGGRVAWRIGQAGVVEFSSDAQKTWVVQPTGIIADLLAGSAPSAKICWIVGRTGTILRTTDAGKHWRKLNPPVQDDLHSVFAVDARQATVSLPNASYQTTDGGATWTKLPPE
jgi:hypothetical protein